MYRISGAILSTNYIQFPKATSQSLGLTGQFIYLVLRPLPTKYFSVHLELATDTGLAVRLSLSNLFKELKTTSTWLQLPFSPLQPESVPQDTRRQEGGRRNKKRAVKFSQRHRWTLLVMDLQAVLMQHLRVNFAYVKNIQLCANILVKGVFTSHAEYSPLVAGGDSGGCVRSQPLPRDMRLPLGKSDIFTEVYDYVRFPFVVTGPVPGQLGCGEGLKKKKVPASMPSVVEVKSVSGEGGKGEGDVRRWRVERERPRDNARVSPCVV